VVGRFGRRLQAFEFVSILATCFTRSPDKRAAFAAKYGCAQAESYDAILKDPSIEAIINTTPNNIHLETTEQAASAGKHVFLDKPIANTVAEGWPSRGCARRRAWSWRSAISAGAKAISAGSKPRSMPAVLANWCRPKGNISRDLSARSTCRPGAIRPLACRARHAADRHPLCRRAGNS